MVCSMPGIPVLQYLLELAQTHVHWVSDAIQPSHPLSSSSPPAFNLSQHQGLFQRVGSSHKAAKVLKLQHQSFQWIFRIDFFLYGLVWSPCCPTDSQEFWESWGARVFSSTTIKEYQFFGALPSLWSKWVTYHNEHHYVPSMFRLLQCLPITLRITSEVLNVAWAAFQKLSWR